MDSGSIEYECFWHLVWTQQGPIGYIIYDEYRDTWFGGIVQDDGQFDGAADHCTCAVKTEIPAYIAAYDAEVKAPVFVCLKCMALWSYINNLPPL